MNRSPAISLFAFPWASARRTRSSDSVIPAVFAALSSPDSPLDPRTWNTVPSAIWRNAEARSRGSTCLTTNAAAPCSSAVRICSGSSIPESITTFTFGNRSRIFARHARPSICGMRMSSNTRSGRVRSISGIASAADRACPTTSMPSATPSVRLIASSINWWSSIATTRSCFTAAVLSFSVPALPGERQPNVCSPLSILGAFSTFVKRRNLRTFPRSQSARLNFEAGARRLRELDHPGADEELVNEHRERHPEDARETGGRNSGRSHERHRRTDRIDHEDRDHEVDEQPAEAPGHQLREAHVQPERNERRSHGYADEERANSHELPLGRHTRRT